MSGEVYIPFYCRRKRRNMDRLIQPSEKLCVKLMVKLCPKKKKKNPCADYDEKRSPTGEY